MHLPKLYNPAGLQYILVQNRPGTGIIDLQVGSENLGICAPVKKLYALT